MEETEEPVEETSEESATSPITGSVVAELGNEISVVVSKDEPYVYELKEGESLEIVSSEQDISFVKESKVDDERLNTISEKTYQNVKQELGIENDFCIYFEDAEGNIVPIELETGTYYGIGNENATIAGQACGQALP